MTEPTSPIELSRRNFLKVGAAGIVGVAGYTVLGHGGGRTVVDRSTAQRPWDSAAARIVPLDQNWRFGGNFVTGSNEPSYDDSGFETVTVPHCVTPLGWRDWSPGSWEQLWIYRRPFDLPAGTDKMRTFVDFDAVLTSATPTINGTTLPQHLGGYLPFSYEVTNYLTQKDNLLAVEVDATWQNVPPEGSPNGAVSIDYFEPGGICRGVRLRMVPQMFIADVFAQPVDVLEASSRAVDVQCTIDSAVVPTGPVEIAAELYDGRRLVSRASTSVTISSTGQTPVAVKLAAPSVDLWSPTSPKLYEVRTTLSLNRQPVHDFTRRIGFREAVFDVDGFFLNGERFKIFGLDRHQTFPYGGMSIPTRMQRRDAELLRQQLNCNMVRCSHYPQSPYFLDACDELGLMVWEETPGWQYIGDAAWQAIVLQNVHDMVVRDRSRPSVIIWGVKPNEAPASYTALYTESKDLAKSLDPSRPTSGTSYHSLTDFVFDVMADDDYTHANGNAELSAPIPGVPYLITEAVGTLDGAPFYRWIDTQTIQIQQARMHAQVHDIANSEDAYSGLLAWCGFDYDSGNGNVYEDIKWPGVCDTFRVLKPGSTYYQAQGDPSAGAVIEPAFYWDFGPTSPVTSLGTTAPIWSNCDHLEAYIDGRHYATLTPDTTDFPNTAHPPFYLDTTGIDASAPPDLRLDGYVSGRRVASRSFSGSTDGDHLQVTLPDTELIADGIDATLLTFRSVDRFGAPRPYPQGDVTVSIDGPGMWVGQLVNLAVTAEPPLPSPGQTATVTATLTNGGFPFQANGGVGGALIRTIDGEPGSIDVTVKHPTLGSQRVRIVSRPGPGGREARPKYPGGATPPLTGVSLALTVPSSWTVKATSPTTFSDVAPSRSVSTTWQVTVTEPSAGAAVVSPSVTADFSLLGQPAATSTTAPVSVELTMAEAYDNVAITDDSDVTPGDLDGVGNSFSAQALAAAGLTPGATFSAGGLSFTWPDVPAAQPDNVLAAGQTILVSGSGSTLGFIGCGSPSDEGGTGTIYYTDGTTSTYEVTLGNYFDTTATGSTAVVTMPYINDSSSATNGGSPQRQHTGTIFYAGVPLVAGKAVQAVTLPTGAAVSGARVTAMHVFALAVG